MPDEQLSALIIFSIFIMILIATSAFIAGWKANARRWKRACKQFKTHGMIARRRKQ